MSERELAVNGGQPIRSTPFPGRRLFDEACRSAVGDVFDRAWETGWDFGFRGEWRERYTREFSDFQGGGYTEAVSAGTAAVYLAICALDLPEGGEVLCSPVTDPGTVSAILMAGLLPVVIDSMPGAFNAGAAEVEAAFTDDTVLVLITHTGGLPVNMPDIMSLANARNVPVLEDASQAHGARWGETMVGCFGEIAVFSTMFSKQHATGGCGGLVFTRNEALYHRVASLSDRGKQFFQAGFNPKEPNEFHGPALNFNQDELSCAIGSVTLKKLPGIVRRRTELVDRIAEGIAHVDGVRILRPEAGNLASYFYATLVLDSANRKNSFAQALLAEGIPINPDYRYIVSDWSWVRERVPQLGEAREARRTRDESINLLFHERFSNQDADDIASAIRKVAHAL